MNSEMISIDGCAELVAAEIATRARIVGIFLALMREKYDVDVHTIAEEANYLAGKIAGRKAAQASRANDLDTLMSLLVDSAATRVFGPELVDSSEESFTLKWKTCPVASTARDFIDLGYGADYLPTLCRILERFDNGFVEGFNPELHAITAPELGTDLLSSGADGCKMIVTTKE